MTSNTHACRALERLRWLALLGPLNLSQLQLTTGIIVDTSVAVFTAIVGVETSCDSIARFFAAGRAFTREEVPELCAAAP
jgi:hypothetical protein